MQMHHGKDLHFINDYAIEDGVGEPVEDESASNSWLGFRVLLGRIGDRVDAVLQRRLEPIRGDRISRQVPKVR